MVLGISSTPYTASSALKSDYMPGVSTGVKPKSADSGLDEAALTASRPIPTVNVSLSTDSQSALRVDEKSSVYSKPGLASTAKIADTSISVSDGQQAASETQQQDQDSSSFSNSIINLTEQEMQIVDKLKARDREVRAHEQAHKAVGGQYAGAISFSYQSGPDGRRYAVGGEVPIDVSPVPGDPQATIAKMTIVKAAATAPAQPSTQDIMVAAEASRIVMEAQNELMLEKRESMAEGAGKEDGARSSDTASNEPDAQSVKSENAKQTDLFQVISSLGSEIESRVDILI